jgi:ABC-type phosphate transport system ATPase subunit
VPAFHLKGEKGNEKVLRCMNETAVTWWKEVRERLEHTARNFPRGFEQQTVFNLLADQDALQLVCEPYSDLEPRLAVYQALYKLFLG